jgi:hypothetical protein
VQEWAATAREASVNAVVGVGGVALAGKVETGKEGFERRVAVDERSEDVGPIFDECTEREEQ